MVCPQDYQYTTAEGNKEERDVVPSLVRAASECESGAVE